MVAELLSGQGPVIMAGDRERQHFSTSCVCCVAPRPGRRTFCAVAIVKWQKLLRDTAAANGRRRRSYWRSSSNSGATVRYLLWAVFASSALGNSVPAAPTPMLDSHSVNESLNSNYVSDDADRGQSVSPLPSATTLTFLWHTLPAGGSQGQSDSHSQTTHHQILAPGPRTPTNLQESIVGDDHPLEAQSTLPTGEHKTSTKKPATAPAIDWDTFSSLVAGRKEQCSPIKRSTSTSETEEQVPKALVRDYTTRTVGLLPGSVTDVAFTAERAARGSETDGDSLWNKGPQRQPDSLEDKLLGSKSSAKVTSGGSGKARVRQAPDDQLSGRDRDTLEDKEGHEQEKTTQNLRGEPVRQATSARQELHTLPSRAGLRATSHTAADVSTGRNLGWDSHVNHQTDADLVNVTEETGQTKSVETRALENILMKILEQDTVTKETSLEGDDKHGLILPLFDSENLAPGHLIREHPGLTQARVDDAALTRTGTSVAEDAGGQRDDDNSLSPRGFVISEDLLAAQTLAVGGLPGVRAIRQATAKSSNPPAAPQQTTEQSNTSALLPDASLLLSHPRIGEQATRHTHGVEAGTEGDTSPASLPLSLMMASARRYEPRQDDTQRLPHGEEVGLSSPSEKVDAGGVPQAESDPLDEEQEFLQLLLSAVRSKDNTAGMKPNADGTSSLIETPTLPTSAGERRTIRRKTGSIISPTRTHAAEDASLSSPVPHPDRRTTSATATTKSGLQRLQHVQEEAVKKRVHWNLPEISKQSATSSEVEAQSGDESSFELTGNAAFPKAPQEIPRTPDAVKEPVFSGATTEWPSSHESAVSGKGAAPFANKSRDAPAEDGSTKYVTALPLKTGVEGARRSDTAVRETLMGTHSSLTADSAISPTPELRHRLRKGSPGEHTVTQRPLAPKPGSRGGMDLEVVPNAGTYTVGPRTATLPVAAQKKQRRRLSFRLREADANSPAESEDDILGKTGPTRVGKQLLTRRHSHSNAALKHNQDVPAVVIPQKSPEQAHLRVSLEAVDNRNRMVEVSLKGTSKFRDSPKTPQEAMTQLLLQKQRLLSTISDLILNVGHGIRPFAAFLGKEDFLNQTAFQKAAETYPEVLRALLFFRLPSRLPAASIRRFHNEVRACEAMVKSLRLTVDQLRSDASSSTAKESLCPHLFKQKADVADQSVRTAQLFARVTFNSYQLACYYMHERRFTDAVHTATTMSRVIPQMYNIFVDAVLPTASASGRAANDAVEEACPFQQHQGATAVKEEISLQRKLIAHLSDLAEHLEVGSRYEAALHKLTALFSRRPRIRKSSPPDPCRSKTRAKARKRVAELFSS